MVSFFPNPYPDELLYSVIARYHTRSGNRGFRQTDMDLFNYHSQQAAKVILSNNLDYLVNNLPIGSKQTKENLIQNHTLYPFYVTFLTTAEAWIVKDLMIKNSMILCFRLLKYLGLIQKIQENSSDFVLCVWKRTRKNMEKPTGIEFIRLQVC